DQGENFRIRGKCLTPVRLFNILPVPSAREDELVEGRIPCGRRIANHDVMRPPLSVGRTAPERSCPTIHPSVGRTGLVPRLPTAWTRGAIRGFGLRAWNIFLASDRPVGRETRRVE